MRAAEPAAQGTVFFELTFAIRLRTEINPAALCVTARFAAMQATKLLRNVIAASPSPGSPTNRRPSAYQKFICFQITTYPIRFADATR